MILAGAFGRLLTVAASCLLFAGCFQVAESSREEENEPNFVEGRNRETAKDIKGAIDSFEKALQANPRSASAHFELGVISEAPEQHDYAAAIYHYERFLNLRPDSTMAAVVRQRIIGCKVELAKGVPFGASRELQIEVEKLTVANTSLRQQMESLKAQLAQHPLVITQYVTNVFARESPAPLPIRTQQPAVEVAHASPPRTHYEPVRPAPTPVARSFTYTVRPNDTVAAIARRFGVSIQSILSANRSLDPRRMRPGQIITIPKG